MIQESETQILKQTPLSLSRILSQKQNLSFLFSGVFSFSTYPPPSIDLFYILYVNFSACLKKVDMFQPIYSMFSNFYITL